MTTIFAVAATALVALTAPAPARAAGSECGPTINPIVCENSKAGTDPEVWDVSGAGDDSIQGFATDISVNAGQRIDFKIDTDATSYKIDIYRTGYYQGKGARFIQNVPVTASLPQHQPECITDNATELYDCGTWGVSASWNVPSTAVSGVYLALLHRNDTGGESHILFVVRNDGNQSDIVFQTSDPTWQAYNPYGGSDFYQGAGNGRAYKISYNRPIVTRGTVENRSYYFSAEFATVQFLERNGYDMSYIAGVDTDRRGSELLNHKVFLSVGHDEYWSQAQRDNMEAARDAGVNLQFLSGNEGYWHTRYEKSADPSHTDYRTIVSYKETWGNSQNPGGGKIDTSTSEWTGTWRDPRFADAAQGGHVPENALTGTMYMVNDISAPLTVTAAEGKYRFWRNTGLDKLAAGTSADLGEGIIGYESDEDVDNGFRPGGLIRMSTTTRPTSQYLYDYGNLVANGTTTHNITMYKAASGALVFSAGSVQWGWGLDDNHDVGGVTAAADVRIQQAQVNLLADMGAQPSTLMSSLKAATKTTDTTAPTTTITSPTPGQAIANGTAVTVTGTASDAGGVVAGVEVSTDGGATWRLASGTTSWSYTYIQQGSGSVPVKARAIDDSGNKSASGTTVNVTVGGPFSLFGQVVPPVASADDAGSIEVGVRFSAEVDGYVTGVRFYKGAANTGQHTGTLWTAQGSKLGSVLFANESATGWQTALFTEPIEVVAGQQYVVSYSAPNGGYAYDEYYWPYKARVTSPLITSSATGNGAAGVFGNIGAFPTTTYHEANYFVDVSFEAATDSPVRLTAQSPSVGASGVAKDTLITTAFTRPVQANSVQMTVTKLTDGSVVAGTLSYDPATRRARFTPTSPLDPVTQYRVAVSATPVDDTSFDAGADWTFTTANDSSSNSCPCSIYTSADVPPIASVADGSVTIGTMFSVTDAGYISGMKFYKGPGNTGTHVGTLWSASGGVLAQATFQNESTTGWQTVLFDAPVEVNPGAVYVVSYVATAGGYAAGPGAFASSVTREPITVPASGGVYTYSGGFPTQTSTTSYYVDPIFVRSASGPQVVSTSPTAGATGVAVDTAISATFNEALAGIPTFAVSANGTAVPGTATLSGDHKTATFSPSADLPFDTVVSVSVTGIEGSSGEGTDRVWSFRTSIDTDVQDVTFFGSATPTASTASDGESVELGMTFRSTLSGRITALRFYRAAGDGASHTGTLWSASGQPLATVVFPNGTTEGWQRAELASPVTITAGQDYTVSYLSPQGKYVYAGGFFGSEFVSGPLVAPAGDNGVFRYGSGGTVPTSSWQSTNYFVDVEFSTGGGQGPALTVVERSPQGGGVAADSVISAKLSGDVAAQISVSKNGVEVEGSSTYTAATRTVTFVPATALSDVTTYVVIVRAGGQNLDQWSFTTAAPDLEGVVANLFGDATPANPTTADDPVELGTAFSVAYPAQATAIRFYKGAGATGAHVGHLWNEAGDLLATVSFDDESASGWQRAALSTPVDLVPGQTYVVSYFAPNGGYSSTGGYFANTVTAGYIVAPGGNNGRFVYTTTGGFPTQTWNSTAYFVDAEVTFAGVPEPTLSAKTPAADAENVDPGSAVISVTLANAATGSISVASGGTAVTGTTSFNAVTGVATFTPTSPLQRGKTYTVTAMANGAPVSGGTWSFTTVPGPAITATTPAADATDVAPGNVVISATLVHATSAAIAVSSGGSAVAGSSAFNPTTGIVTFTPTAALARGATYSVTVTANGAAVPDGSWSFSTTASPSLTAKTPAADATNVHPATAVISATLANASAATIAVTTGGVAVAGSSSFNAASGVVTFTPTSALQRAKAYSVTVTADGAAVTGGTWSFTTAPNPAITSRTPAASATGVHVNSTITATLSNAATATIAVTSNGSPVAGTSSFNADTGVVTFTPSAALAFSRSHSVTVTADGAAVSSGTWSFTTIAQASRSASSPAANATNVIPSGLTITATLSSGAQAGAIVLKQGTTEVPGTSTYNATTRVVTFTPSATLDWTKSYTATVTANGGAVSGGTWSFTTIAQASRASSSPAADAATVNPTGLSITATLSSGAQAGAISLKQGTASVAGTSSYNASTRVVTFTPTTPLEWSKAYTATVTANGGAVANGTWSFTTMALPAQASLFTTGTPANANQSAVLAYQVGTRFKSGVPGLVTSIRFYKGNLNTGSHIGYLRSANGTVLGQVTFSNETSSGWQTAILATPVHLNANTEYRVTVYNSSGRYAYTSGGLATPVISGPLSTLGGVAGLGTGNPTTTSTNKFWVDVIFEPDN